MLNRKLIEDFFSKKRRFEGIKRELEISKINKIISIVGPRRSGKTWFFYYLLERTKQGCYVNFEDIAFKSITAEEFFEVIKIFTELKYRPKTLFLDEVQTIEGWQTLVRSLYDRGYKVFITGSSSKLLSKEIATQLRGRTLTYFLLPFSFNEFLNAKKTIIDPHTFEGRGEILKLLKEYLKFGGFPEVVMSKGKEKILKEYSEEIFYKDFVERHKIKSFAFGRFLFEFCFQNFSKEISLRKIKSFFGKKISDTTLYEYVEKLQDTLIVFFLERFSKNIYERKSWPTKIYVCDTGMSKIFGFSDDIGRKMENVVFLDLLRKTNKNPTLSFFYWRDYQQHEVDFVVKQGPRVKQLIQVTYALDKDEIEGREIKALIKASELLKCKNLLVITWDYESEEKIKDKKIKFLPLWKWMLRFNFKKPQTFLKNL